MNNPPLVSVYVITYNSSKYVIETLESIKNQTYQNIELIVSDDCSTDSTVQLCREWLNNNSTRFKRVELLIVDKNTGIAANCNRAETACQGEWAKNIAGDDLLTPNCVADCMDYVDENQDVVVLFGKIKPFGGNIDLLKRVENNYDYTFFNKTISEQLHYLLFNRNCLSAPASFKNIRYLKGIGLINDERIPFMEDYPQWINMLKNGIKFHFIDKSLVYYRVGSSISTSNMPSLSYFRSQRLFRFYYQYPSWTESDLNDAVITIVGEECKLYDELLRTKSSCAYRIGFCILMPVKFIKTIIRKIKTIVNAHDI